MKSLQDNDSKEMVHINGLHPYDREGQWMSSVWPVFYFNAILFYQRLQQMHGNPPINIENYTRNHNHEILMNPECSDREEEKIYEDLCYVTFSSTLPQVRIENHLQNLFVQIKLIIYYGHVLVLHV